MPARSFGDYLRNLPTNDDGNKNSSSFHLAFGKDVSHDDRVRHVTGDEDNVFLCFDGEKAPQMIHSIKNFGNTFRRKDHKIVGIVGMDQEGAVIQLKHDSVAEDCKFAAPKMSDYEKCNSREDILKMKTPRGGFKGKYDGASGVLLAPFAVEALIKE